ncbi:inner membrane protein [Klebsiella pneumoniae]|uniref:Inner membrane protein n=1 Tax=Klebsiella pneumoniae TaxID=573 RepID=A0A377UYN0_KLEPN|nr:inner membrane protein [Klebsiella pneumoniae]
MLKHMEKLAELKRAKLLALSLLLIAAAIFITTLALPPSPWVGALKAISEAAMVGAAGRLVCGRGSVSPYSAALCRPPYGDYSAQ